MERYNVQPNAGTVTVSDNFHLRQPLTVPTAIWQSVLRVMNETLAFDTTALATQLGIDHQSATQLLGAACHEAIA